jgi:hypothetical protein
MREWGIVGLFGIIGIAGLAFWIWCLVDAIRVPDDSQFQSGTKLLWVLIIALTGWIGAIIYLAVGRPVGGAKQAIADWQSRPAPSMPAGGSVPPPPPAPTA